MKVTADTTLAELGAAFKAEKLGLRFCHMGAGFIAFVRQCEGPEWLGYGRDLAEAVQCALDRRKSLDDLLDRSSLGTPEAKAIRASADPEAVRRVLDRVDELDAAARRNNDMRNSFPLGKPEESS